MDDIPKDFSAALKQSGMTEFFMSNPPSHRREYLKWVLEAKKPETRKTRIEKAMKMLAGKSAEKAARAKSNA